MSTLTSLRSGLQKWLPVGCGLLRVTSLSMSSSAAAAPPSFETLVVSQPAEYVYHVELNRPEKRNAMNDTFWREMPKCFSYLASESSCRSVVISGRGKIFTAGLDLTDAASTFVGDDPSKDVARKAFDHRRLIKDYQETFTCIEKCPKPAIVAIHGACVGGGLDLITACDIRLCTADAWFQIKEVDVGLAADVGTLQRLPKVVGNNSVVRELVYTARKFTAKEALSIGLVSQLFENQSSLLDAAMKLASLIASKSPVAVQGSKVNLNYSRDHTVDESLDYIANWNMSMLQTEDLPKSFQAAVTKEPPVFSKL